MFQFLHIYEEVLQRYSVLWRHEGLSSAKGSRKQRLQLLKEMGQDALKKKDIGGQQASASLLVPGIAFACSPRPPNPANKAGQVQWAATELVPNHLCQE